MWSHSGVWDPTSPFLTQNGVEALFFPHPGIPVTLVILVQGPIRRCPGWPSLCSRSMPDVEVARSIINLGSEHLSSLVPALNHKDRPADVPGARQKLSLTGAVDV